MDLEEIFEHAIDQEIKAREIYGRSAAQTDNVETSALFRILARMEWARRRALATEKRLLPEAGELERDEKETAEELVVGSLRHVSRVLCKTGVEAHPTQAGGDRTGNSGPWR